MKTEINLLETTYQNKDDDNFRSAFEQMYYIYHIAFCEGKVSEDQALIHFKEVIEQNEHLI